MAAKYSRDRFSQHLKTAGLTPGQVSHVANMYARGERTEANRYLRSHGVTRRSSTETASRHFAQLKDAASKNMIEKVGAAPYINFASFAELLTMRTASKNEIRKRAGKKPRRLQGEDDDEMDARYNPFWYHTAHVQSTIRQLYAARHA